MADNGELVIPITANVTGLDAGLSRGAAKVTEFGNTTSTAFKKVEKSTEGAVAAGIIYARVLEGVYSALKQVVAGSISYYGQLDNLADATQVNAEKLHLYTKAGQLAGVETEGLAGALVRMNSLVGEAALGTSSAADKLAKLGLTLKDVKGKDTEQMFELIAKRISETGSAFEQAALMTEFFGRSSNKMLGMMKDLPALLDAAGSHHGKYAEDINGVTRSYEEMGKTTGVYWTNLKAYIGDGLAKYADIFNAHTMTREAVEKLTHVETEQEKASAVAAAKAQEAAKVAAQASAEALKDAEDLIQKKKDLHKANLAAAESMTGQAKESSLSLKVGDDPIALAHQKRLVIIKELEDFQGTAEQNAKARAAAEKARAADEIMINNDRAKQIQEIKEANDAAAIEAKAREDEVAAAAIEANNAIVAAAEKKSAEIKAIEQARLTQYFNATKETELQIQALKKTGDEYENAQLAEQALEQEKFNKSARLRHQQHLDDLHNQRVVADEQRAQLSEKTEDQVGTMVSQKKLEYAQEQQQNDLSARVMWESGERGKLDLAEQFLDGMSAMMESNNKQAFAIGKAASIASTIFKTYEGAQAAFTGMAVSFPGPVGIALGTAAAAAAVVAGMARVQKIASTQMGGSGGGGGSYAGGGGGGSSNMGGPAQQNNSNVNVTLYGDAFSAKQVQGLVGLINSKAVDNNMTLHTQVSSGYSG